MKAIERKPKDASASDEAAAQYLPAIDGLRAFAVVPVVLFHSNIGFSGGYVGVDIFFVISGFLITRIVLRDIRNGSFAFGNFWKRRVRRLLPAATVVLTVTTLFASWLFSPQDLREFGQSLIANSLLSSNFYFFRESGYFATANEYKPLLHTWSLSIEEQFYLAYPFLLAGLIRWIPKALLGSMIFMTLVSFITCIVTTSISPTGAFYLLPSRAWELLLGGVVSLLVSKVPRSQGSIHFAAWLGVLACIYSMLSYDNQTAFPGWSAFVPCLGASAMILSFSVCETSKLSRVFSSPALVLVGKVSYSLYLWHWPVIVFSNYLSYEKATIGTRLVIVGIYSVLAILSWRLVEIPFRRPQTSRFRYSPFLVSSVLFFCAGFLMHWTNGLPNRIRPEFSIEPDQIEVRGMDKDGTKYCMALANPLDNLRELPDRHEIDLLLWGDSHASNFSPLLKSLCDRFKVSGCISYSPGVPPLLGVDPRHDSQSWSSTNRILFNEIQSRKIRNVLLIARWGHYAQYENLALRVPARPEWTIFENGLRNTIRQLDSLGIQTIIATPVPPQSVPIPRAYYVSKRFHLFDSKELSADFDVDNRRISQLIGELCSERRRVHSVRIWEALVMEGKTPAIHDGICLYKDDNHLSLYGTSRCYDLFRELVEGLNVRQERGEASNLNRLNPTIVRDQ